MKHVEEVVALLLRTPGARKTTKYVDPKYVVVACRRFKPDRRERNIDIVLTIGKPNYADRKYIATLKKAGESFPVKKIRIKHYPVKK